MRRRRSVKEQRESMQLQKLELKKKPSVSAKAYVRKSSAIQKVRTVKTYKPVAARSRIDIGNLGFTPYESKRQWKVCHIIESLGLGGGQTMMMELVNGLNKYYPKSNSVFLCINRTDSQSYNRELYSTYGIDPIQIHVSQLNDFCKRNSVDVVLHHRISVSKCVKNFIPRTKYVVLNHTINNPGEMKLFDCSAYVSCCDYLLKTPINPSIDRSRYVSILNGIEYPEVYPIKKEHDIIGRCHRMTQGKFDPDSVTFLEEICRQLGIEYHHIGKHKYFNENTLNGTIYHENILDRKHKMSLVSNFDLFYYETTTPEGASVSLLESLSCGVPVLTRPHGGCKELVKNGVNGYFVNSRSDYKQRIHELFKNKDRLQELKTKCLDDFDSRLHIRHTACKYMQLFDAVMEVED